MTFGEILIYIVSFFGLFTSIYFFLTLTENRNRIGNPKPKKNYPDVTIIVPAYNEEHTIEKTIKSLLSLNYPKNKLHISVVDDGSTDNTYRIAKKYESKQVTVTKKKNGGKASAMNLALEQCRTELVGCLDADSIVSPDALKNMIGFFNNSRVMAVTPSLKVYETKTILQKIQMIEYLLGIFLRKIFAFLGSIHVTPGPFTIYRRNFFRKYGGYDENNLTEDIEIALRIQSYNYIIENSANAIVYTIAPKKWDILYKQRLRWYIGFTSNIITYKKLFDKQHGNLGLLILPASFISVILVITTLFYTTYKITERIITDLTNLHNIDFDIWSLLKPNIDPFFFNLNAIAFIGTLSLIASITIIWTAKKLSEEKSSLKTPYLLFLLLYWPLYAYWWLMSWTYMIIGKKIDWGHKSIKSQQNSKDLKYKTHENFRIQKQGR